MTLAIWKWRSLWPLRIGKLVMRSLDQGRCPYGLVRFDAEFFAHEMRQRFGDPSSDAEAPFIIDVCDFTGHGANWILLECGWHVPEESLAEVVRMCAQRGLHVHSE